MGNLVRAQLGSYSDLAWGHSCGCSLRGGWLEASCVWRDSTTMACLCSTGSLSSRSAWAGSHGCSIPRGQEWKLLETQTQNSPSITSTAFYWSQQIMRPTQIQGVATDSSSWWRSCQGFVAIFNLTHILLWKSCVLVLRNLVTFLFYVHHLNLV